VEVLEGEEEFCAVEATAFFVKLLFSLEVVEELSPVDESTSRRSEREVVIKHEWHTHASTRYNFCSD
jgi:hypothetical protein